MKTAVTEQLGIDFPILAFSHCRDVVAEVSKAGGMGVLGAIAFSPEALEVELAWIEKEIGDKPYGVDILLPSREGEVASGARSVADILPETQVDFVLGLLAEHGIEATREELWGSWRLAREGSVLWSKRSASLLDVALDHPIKLIASALGSPTDEMIRWAREKGIKTAALAGKVEHALRSVAQGVDFIVAQGTEAGGHTGEIATMVLVPEIVDAVAPVPVIAAGGIGRGRQVAAALALGAEGVWCGSVWLTTEEAETEIAVKEKFLAATSSDTVRTRARTGKPARQLRSAWTEAWNRPGAPPPLPAPLQGLLSEPPLRRAGKVAQQPGSPARALATYFVGQIVGSMNRVTTTRQVIYDMMNEYADVIERLSTLSNE
jgi:NAD(P)H-dependent flavin oxidoreductase YrpB (nitropropane dioxygenase family)